MIARVKGMLLWLLCISAGIISAVWMLLAVLAGSQRAGVISLGFDQLANSAIGGDEDMLISTRCWVNRAQPRYERWMRVINWLFNDPNHCKNSAEYERRKFQSTPDDTGFFTSEGK